MLTSVQDLVEERRRLVDEKTEQINRFTSQLKIHFPQMLDWFDRLDREAPQRSPKTGPMTVT